MAFPFCLYKGTFTNAYFFVKVQLLQLIHGSYWYNELEFNKMYNTDKGEYLKIGEELILKRV